jgi:hypothetical protein
MFFVILKKNNEEIKQLYIRLINKLNSLKNDKPVYAFTNKLTGQH